MESAPITLQHYAAACAERHRTLGPSHRRESRPNRRQRMTAHHSAAAGRRQGRRQQAAGLAEAAAPPSPPHCATTQPSAAQNATMHAVRRASDQLRRCIALGATTQRRRDDLHGPPQRTAARRAIRSGSHKMSLQVHDALPALATAAAASCAAGAAQGADDDTSFGECAALRRAARSVRAPGAGMAPRRTRQRPADRGRGRDAPGCRNCRFVAAGPHDPPAVAKAPCQGQPHATQPALLPAPRHARGAAARGRLANE